VRTAPFAEPFARFGELLARARAEKEIREPTAMSIATVGEGGRPSLRMVLLKDFDERGFVFYTNLGSRKARELAANPNVALCFHWQPFEIQVRIEGRAEPVSDEEADGYYASRPGRAAPAASTSATCTRYGPASRRSGGWGTCFPDRRASLKGVVHPRARRTDGCSPCLPRETLDQ
jgi:pyridoxine/pyridoxamine 5'-phosphate oxidase